jgi:hypothetical protein
VWWCMLLGGTVWCRVVLCGAVWCCVLLFVMLCVLMPMLLLRPMLPPLMLRSCRLCYYPWCYLCGCLCSVAAAAHAVAFAAAYAHACVIPVLSLIVGLLFSTSTGFMLEKSLRSMCTSSTPARIPTSITGNAPRKVSFY